MKKRLILFFIIFSIVLHATVKEKACVKYKKSYGWSHGYPVIVTIISGSNLNSVIGSFTKYDSFSTYAIVFWDEHKTSIFKLPPMSMGALPMFEQEVEDQERRKWKIKKGHDFCY